MSFENIQLPLLIHLALYNFSKLRLQNSPLKNPHLPNIRLSNRVKQRQIRSQRCKSTFQTPLRALSKGFISTSSPPPLIDQETGETFIRQWYSALHRRHDAIRCQRESADGDLTPVVDGARNAKVVEEEQKRGGGGPVTRGKGVGEV